MVRLVTVVLLIGVACSAAACAQAVRQRSKLTTTRATRAAIDAQIPDDHGLHAYSKAIVRRAQRRYRLALALCLVGLSTVVLLVT